MHYVMKSWVKVVQKSQVSVLVYYACQSWRADKGQCGSVTVHTTKGCKAFEHLYSTGVSTILEDDMVSAIRLHH